MDTREEVVGLRFLLRVQTVLLAVCILLIAYLLMTRQAVPESAETAPATAAATVPATVPAAETTVPEISPPLTRAEQTIQTFAAENDIPVDAYPESLVALLERNPETEDFVLHYPLEYGVERQADLSAYEEVDGVPLFMQWDRQWGYMDYGSDVAGLTACGPVCLSMVAYYLTGDPAMSPDNMIRFALENGYCAPGDGTYWSLMDQGGSALGLDVTMLYIEEEIVMDNLAMGNPIVAIMGPGDFTASGHYVVFAGAEDGRIRINDPNSYANSQRLWSYDEIAEQIDGLWVMRYFG